MRHFDYVNSGFYRLTMDFSDPLEGEDLLLRLLNELLQKNTEVYIFGVRENSFFKTDEEVRILKIRILEKLSIHGSFLDIVKDADVSLYAFVTIFSLDDININIITDCWNYFESIFILKARNKESLNSLFKKEMFSFSTYSALLESDQIELCICKLEHDEIGIDSGNLNLFEIF